MMRKSKLMTKFSERLKNFKQQRQPDGEQQQAISDKSSAATSGGRCNKLRRRSRGSSLPVEPQATPTIDNQQPASHPTRERMTDNCEHQSTRRTVFGGDNKRQFAPELAREQQPRTANESNRTKSENLLEFPRDSRTSRVKTMAEENTENRLHVMMPTTTKSSGGGKSRNICRRIELFEANSEPTAASGRRNKTSRGYEHTTELKRRKVAISNFMMILFGLVTVFSFVALMSCNLEPKLAKSNSDQLTRQLSNKTTRTTTTAAAAAAAIALNATTKLNDQLATTTTTSNQLFPLTNARKISENGESDDDDGEPSTNTADAPTTASYDDNNSENEEPQESPDKSQRTKLGELILDAADGGADLLVKHMSPKDQEESADDGEQLAAAAPLELNHSNATHEQKLKFALDTYEKWRATADDLIELFSRKLLPIVVEHGYDVDTTTVAGLLQVFNGIRGLRPWALKLLDASAKLTPGLLVGTQSDFGDFDECLGIRVDDPTGFAAANSDFVQEIDPKTNLPTTTLVGRYCLADVEFPKPPRIPAGPGGPNPELLNGGYLPIELRRPLLNFSETATFKDTIWVETANFFHMLYVDPIRVGICLTNKIDPDNFQQVFNKLLEEFRVTINFRQRCVTKYDVQEAWTVYQLSSAYMLLVVCCLVGLSTLAELLYKKWDKLPTFKSSRPSPAATTASPTKPNQVSFFASYRLLLTSFSLIRNTKRLFKAPGLQATVTRPREMQLNATADLHSERQHYNNKSNLIQILAQQQQQRGSIAAASTATDSSGCATDSSVESSPSIERRSSSIDAGSAVNLIGANSSTPTSSLFNFNNNNNAQPRGSSASNEGAYSPAASTSGAGNNINLLNLHGIRVITMTWMIVNHTYLFGGFFVLWAHRRLIDIAEWPKSVSFQLVLNGWLTVETYFFLSALIVVLNLMPLLRKRKFNYFAYILHRLIRLIPAYLGLVCLNFLWPRISSGPVWLVKGKSFIETPCENYLWTNFLFINNWIWPEKQCMVHTWFLSADFQLYLFAPAIVYLLYRRPALGHSMNLLVAIIASIFSGFVIYANELLPATLINKLEFDSIKQQLSYSYFATYQHMGPYCLGILTGYLLHKRPDIRLPKHLTWLLWILLPPLSFTTLLLTYLWNGAYNEPGLINPSPLVSAVYVAIHRTIWTSLVAWIVFACSTGRAKLLSNFLSHPIFVPLSRLSFSIYLVHLPVIMFRSLNLRHTIEWTDSNILWEACGNFVFSLIMGYFLNVAFESPIINLENFICGRERTVSAPAGHYKRQTLGAQILGGLEADKHRVDPTPNERKLTSLPQHLLYNDDSHQSDKTISQSVAENDRSASTSDESSSGRNDATEHAAESTNDDQLESPRYSDSGSVGGQPTRASQTGGQFSPALGSPHHQQQQLAFKRNWADVGSKIQRDSVGESGGKHLTTNQLIEQRRLSNLRILAMNERALHRSNALRREATSANGQADDLYNIVGEYQHYAPGSYQRWRMAGGLSSRPKQYATLARTDHLDASSAHSRREPFEHLSRPLRQRPDPDHRLSLYKLDAPTTSREANSIGREPRSNQGHERQWPAGPTGYGSSISRRQGRYNTLTGTGTGDWRLQYARPTHDDHYSPAWQRTSMEPQQQQQQQYDLPRSNPNWLQQTEPLMIPRIDSSTLRRQTRRNETTESSIVEEPLDEESSDL